MGIIIGIILFLILGRLLNTFWGLNWKKKLVVIVFVLAFVGITVMFKNMTSTTFVIG